MSERLGGGAVPGPGVPFQPSPRYPDPAVQVMDPAFLKYRLFSSVVEQVATGMRWAEGPVWLPAERAVLVSDIPNDRILRYDERSGAVDVFRAPSNHANGNTLDRQGRLVTCEHLTRRVTRTERDGTITVLADAYEGRPLNSPNDVVVASDGSVWFTDPTFGINGEWEGARAPAGQPTTNVYRLRPDGVLEAAITELVNPNGLAFSPDERTLYVVEWRGTPDRSIWAYDVHRDGGVSRRTKVVDASDGGALDGFRVDADGNLWCGWGSTGALAAEPVARHGRRVYPLRAEPSDLDGVRVVAPDGTHLAHIALPERCANLCFGGPKRNRLYMASCRSLYALYVETHGAV